MEHKRSAAGNLTFRYEAVLDHSPLTILRAFSNKQIKKKLDPMVDEFRYKKLGVNFS